MPAIFSIITMILATFVSMTITEKTICTMLLVMASLFLPGMAHADTAYYTTQDSIVLYENPALDKLLDIQNTMTDFVFKDESILGHRKPSFRLVPGINRNPGYGFSLGIGGAVSFYTDSADWSLKRSDVPVYFGFTLSKPFSYRITADPVFYFNENKLKLSANILYRDWLEYYYGVGYGINKATRRDKEYNTYKSKMFQFAPKIHLKLCPYLYAGIAFDIWHETVSNPTEFLLSDPYYIAMLGSQDKASATGTGVGINVNYDSRDFPNDAYQGALLDLSAMIYTYVLGGNTKYGTLAIDYRQYVRLGNYKRVIAWNLTSNNTFGNNIPFMRYATIGGINDFRGYYDYQYRDKSILTAQLEYRHMIEVDSEWGILLNRFGFAAWAGVGFMGSNPVKYNAVLPQVGAGLRFAVRDRLNFRLDVAYNTVDRDVLWYFSFSEAF